MREIRGKMMKGWMLVGEIKAKYFILRFQVVQIEGHAFSPEEVALARDMYLLQISIITGIPGIHLCEPSRIRHARNYSCCPSRHYA
ncbi:hypothetical protein PIB30_089884 [Stylosanthes scabra]|uniref:Uncharacterized protein n=1 Tax=Stylosanthes scabra TaxID=79078 RepID=A0ABU6VSK0_9FABA|nr:hypothetical protein [Stylosanthes scabra]